MSSPDETQAWLTLACAPGVRGANLRQLLARFGSAQALLDASNSQLAGFGAERTDIQSLREAQEATDIAPARAWLRGANRHLISCLDKRYPAALSDIPDPPIVLFAEGDTDLLNMPALAMVGSRNPTAAGTDNAGAFAKFVAARGLAVVSGLAAGIDAAAHQGALDADGATIAVLGCGIDQCYPTANRGLQQRIASEGVVISEYPPGRAPIAGQFPARNRIISGLSLGTLVVEATRRSGSLITARLAGEQGRSIFAIPGSIHNPLARGCHQLIRQGALLVEDGDDIFSELGGAIARAIATIPGDDLTDNRHATPDDDEDPAYDKVLDALGWDPANMDQLVDRTGLTTAELSSMLLIMELDGRVNTLPGGGYQRCKQRKA